MEVSSFTFADAMFDRSKGQNGDASAGNVVDQRGGAPITIGFGRYALDQTIEDMLAVDDVMIVLEG